MQEISIREYHALKGEFPAVQVNHPGVDEQALLEGDTDPMFLTLPIAEVGRKSDNGIWYDEALVTTIAEQLPGLGGIRGHIPDGMEDSAFPLEEVFWVGHELTNGVLWAKGYVPPSPTREFIRLKKAQGGRIATSIYGSAIKEVVKEQGEKRGFRLRNLTLKSVDLAPAHSASLKNQHGFAITKEMSEGEGDMPDILTAADVPQNIREQIIKESQVSGRVAELETRNMQLEQQVTEMATYKTIVAEIRATIGKDTETVQVVTEYHNMAMKLAELMGVPYSNICIKVEEMHEQVAEMRRGEFTRAVDDKIAEFTRWNTAGKPEAEKRVNDFRAAVKARLVGALNGDTAKIAETAQTIWDAEFKSIAELIVQSLAGPAAIVGGNTPPNNKVKTYTPEEIEAARSRVGF